MTSKNFITVTEYKLLLTINYLNELGYYPSSLGVLKIITGVVDEESEMFVLCPTFQVLVSYNQKRLSRDINKIVKRGYLKKFYNSEEDDCFFELSEKGKEAIMEFAKHHKVNLKKHEIKKKRTIIKK